MASPKAKTPTIPVLDPRELAAEAEVTAVDALLDALRYDPKQIIEIPYTIQQLVDEAGELSESFIKFIPKAWSIVEPAPFVPNWHIDALAEHLEAITKGDILDLLVTMPPRHSKSLLIAVLWATWEWCTIPQYRWVFASYAFSLSVRDSGKRRKLIQSKWYRDRWGDKFHLIAEQNTKIRYENNKGGFMLASSVGGTNTGEGGERIVVDDPHNVKKSESEQIRLDTVDWWNITMSTRRNDLKRSARVVVQQRVHEGDVAGDIIKKGGFVHLNLPTEFGFAGAPRSRTGWTSKATGQYKEWVDPRQVEGELLNPKRFDHQDNEKAKIDLGDYQYAAQHGQNPTPPKGQIIQSQWLRYYGNEKKGQPPIPDFAKCQHQLMPLLSLDCSFKEHKDTDFVAGLCWAMFGADVYLLPLCIHRRANFPDTVDAVAEMVGGQDLEKTKTHPGIYPFIKIKLVEDKANGSAIISTLQHRIPGMIAFSPDGASKQSRLEAASWRFRAGNIFLPDESIAPWVREYVYELCAFPKAKRDDYVDATSQALLFIGGDSTAAGTPVMSTQESMWFGLGENDLSVSSPWGPVGEVSRSIWRQ